MKIIYFSPHPNLHLELASGPGTHMREIIREFEVEGHEVIPVIMGVAPDKGGENFQASTSGYKSTIKKMIPGIAWHTLEDINLRRFDGHANKMLSEAVEKCNPDLIYERGYFLMTSGVDVANKYGIKHILEMNAPYPEEKIEMEGASLLNQAALKAEKKQFEKTDLIVVVSSALKSYVGKISKVAEGKTIVVPNAIRPDKFKVAEEETRKIKSELELPDQGVVFGFVGSIFPYHGVAELIDAFCEIALADSHLVIVGDGEILTELKQKANDSKHAGQIHFTGKVAPEKVPDYISAMDVCVMAKSNWYGSPVKIFEYGAMDKAIIAPRNIPVQDAMTHGVDGLLVDGQPELIQAMKDLQENQSLRKELAHTFYQKVLDQYTWKQVAKSTLSSLQKDLS